MSADRAIARAHTSTVVSDNTPSMAKGDDDVMAMLKELREGQHSLQRNLDKKVDKLKKDLFKQIDLKMKDIKDELALDIGRIDTKLIELERKLRQVYDKHGITDGGNPTDISDITIFATGIPQDDQENLNDKINVMLQVLGEDVVSNITVTHSVRLRNRRPGAPGCVIFF